MGRRNDALGRRGGTESLYRIDSNEILNAYGTSDDEDGTEPELPGED
jgi:hypothetical protein